MANRLPTLLALVFILFWAFWAVDPYDRAVWWAENLPVIGIFLLLVLTYRVFRFSNTAYLLMAVWMFWHTVGGHYTFERVPFDGVTDLFGWERNHFDRIGHYTIGLWSYPVAELMRRRGWITRTVPVLLFALFSIMALAAAYEIIEWWFAALQGGEEGASFLGSQGDVWDAQKDMLLDTLGALTGLAIFLIKRPDR
ncbi:MAG: DUF2238 domain-containing protein [Alphaproteobacteria bacterium]